MRIQKSLNYFTGSSSSRRLLSAMRNKIELAYKTSPKMAIKVMSQIKQLISFSRPSQKPEDSPSSLQKSKDSFRHRIEDKSRADNEKCFLHFWRVFRLKVIISLGTYQRGLCKNAKGDVNVQ